MVTVILIGVSVCCVLVADKVQTLVDFNEVPAEEKLPLVCQITPGVPCMPLSHHRSIAPTRDLTLSLRDLITVAFLLADHTCATNNIARRAEESNRCDSRATPLSLTH